MFDYCTGLETFNCDLPNLTDGRGMFQYCTNLTSFTSKLSSLTDSYKMFYGCKLTSFNCDLPSLTIGREMFYGCSQLTSFNGDLSSLTDSDYMFTYCSQLTTFSTDLPKLKNGQYMFYCCDNLTSFSSDLSSLTNGSSMFYHSSALTAFSSDLSSLTNGNNMFRDCPLDAQSVERILTTIPDYGSEYLKSIGITMDVAACPKASEIVGLVEGQTIPQNPSEIGVKHRGWWCYLSCANGSYTVPSGISEYDVVEGSAYIPDASSWYSDRENNGLVITRVENGIAYNDNN
jgi:hypothetical protein